MLNRALKLLRTYHQLKQGELAKRLDIANSYLSEIETGVKTPSIDLLQKYAVVFKIPVSSIILFSEKIDDPKRTSEKLRVVAADKILRLLEWIDERDSVEQI
jgi:transcriptional regulator with XRE-family HTH domain